MPRENVESAIIIRPAWHPAPVPEPRIDPLLTRRSAIERSTEVLTYWCFRLEWWVSPGGTLREWLRLNFYAALFIAIPTFLIVPLVTILLTQFVTWTALLAAIVRNLIIAQCLGVAAIAVLFGLVLLIRALFSKP